MPIVRIKNVHLKDRTSSAGLCNWLVIKHIGRFKIGRTVILLEKIIVGSKTRTSGNQKMSNSDRRKSWRQEPLAQTSKIAVTELYQSKFTQGN